MAEATSTGSVDLWNAAFQLLEEDEKQEVSRCRQDITASNLLCGVLEEVERKKQQCIDRRWRYRKRNGNVIVLHDVADKIIKWVRKFQEVGDIAVQYDPTHAALPWAGVRFLLQIAISDSQTFGAMMEGLETVTNIISRAAILESLYSQAESEAAKAVLQTLKKLYVTILRFLCHAKQFYSRSTASRIAHSLVQTSQSTVDACLLKVSAAQRDVDSSSRIADSVAQQSVESSIRRLENKVDLVSTKSVQKLLRILEGFNLPMKRYVEPPSGENGLSQEARKSLLHWLSTTPHRQHHEALWDNLLPGTCEWLQGTAMYRDWMDSSASSILWLHGAPGSGKTMLVASVVERILCQPLCRITHKVVGIAPLAYFYCICNSAEPGRAAPEEILRTILKQLACPRLTDTFSTAITNEYKLRKHIADTEGLELTKLNTEDSIRLLLRLTEDMPAIIVIDALDECDPLRRHELITALERLVQESANLVKILVSSRDDGDIMERLREHKMLQIAEKDTSSDMAKFIDEKISQCIAEKRLLKGKVAPKIRDLIVQTLKSEAQGMFQWVALQIENICNPRRVMLDGDLLSELGKLPPTLAKSYECVFQQIQDSGSNSRQIAVDCFVWLLCAKRLLKSDELITALSIEGRTTGRLSLSDVLQVTGNLVVYDPQLDSFRFSHSSVRDFLQALPQFESHRQNLIVTTRCLEYVTVSQLLLAKGADFNTDYSYQKSRLVRAAWASRVADLKDLSDTAKVEDRQRDKPVATPGQYLLVPHRPGKEDEQQQQQLRIDRLIQEDSFSCTYEVTRFVYHGSCTLKVMSKKTLAKQGKISQVLFEKFAHVLHGGSPSPFVARIIRCFQDSETLYVLSDLRPRWNLSQVASWTWLDRGTAKKWITQILSALTFLESLDLSYVNIGLASFWMTFSENIQFFDFGLRLGTVRDAMDAFASMAFQLLVQYELLGSKELLDALRTTTGPWPEEVSFLVDVLEGQGLLENDLRVDPTSVSSYKRHGFFRDVDWQALDQYHAKKDWLWGDQQWKAPEVPRLLIPPQITSERKPAPAISLPTRSFNPSEDGRWSSFPLVGSSTSSVLSTDMQALFVGFSHEATPSSTWNSVPNRGHSLGTQNSRPSRPTYLNDSWSVRERSTMDEEETRREAQSGGARNRHLQQDSVESDASPGGSTNVRLFPS